LAAARASRKKRIRADSSPPYFSLSLPANSDVAALLNPLFKLAYRNGSILERKKTRPWHRGHFHLGNPLAQTHRTAKFGVLPTEILTLLWRSSLRFQVLTRKLLIAPLKIGFRRLKLAAHIDPVRDGQPYRQAGALLEELLPEISGWGYAISNGRTSPGALTIQGSRDANNIPNT
jgi:hypothetical protein